MAVFWFVAPCSLVEVYHHFRGPCCLHYQGNEANRPDDGGSKDVGKLLPDYTALQPRRQPSLYSPPWEPQVLDFVYSRQSASNFTLHIYFSTSFKTKFIICIVTVADYIVILIRSVIFVPVLHVVRKCLPKNRTEVGKTVSIPPVLSAGGMYDMCILK
jgi:hypothetical protein